MGDDKIKVLKELNLKLLFPPSRYSCTSKIRELWNKFSDLYDALHNVDNTDPEDFETSAILPKSG